MSEQGTPPKASASKVKWLLGELPGWVAEGLIGQEAADKIAERYRLAQTASGRTKLVYVVGTLAALLLGTGVILFFAANWQAIPRFGKLAIICTALVASYWVGYELKYKREFEIVGESIILLGSILFGAGIYLVAQAFHLETHFPNGVLLWMLGLVPLFFLVRSKPLLAEVTFLFCLWIILEFVAATEFGHHDLKPLFIRCCIGVFVLGGIIRLIYRYGGKANAALIVPSILVWFTIFLAGLTQEFDLVHEGHLYLLYVSIFLAIGAVGVLHRLNRDLPPFGGVYQLFAIPVVAIQMFLLTFPDISKDLIDHDFWWFPVLLSVVFLFVVVGIWMYLSGKADEVDDPFALSEIYIYMALGFFVLILFFLFKADGAEIFIGMLANLVFFGFIVSLIVIGYRGGYPLLVNFGVFFFVIDFLTRYFDWFWDLLPRSLFFIVGGLLLLVGGIYLEKSRKQWVLKAKEAAR